jgi:hypothetical protein
MPKASTATRIRQHANTADKPQEVFGPVRARGGTPVRRPLARTEPAAIDKTIGYRNQKAIRHDRYHRMMACTCDASQPSSSGIDLRSKSSRAQNSIPSGPSRSYENDTMSPLDSVAGAQYTSPRSSSDSSNSNPQHRAASSLVVSMIASRMFGCRPWSCHLTGVTIGCSPLLGT